MPVNRLRSMPRITDVSIKEFTRPLRAGGSRLAMTYQRAGWACVWLKWPWRVAWALMFSWANLEGYDIQTQARAHGRLVADALERDASESQ